MFQARAVLDSVILLTLTTAICERAAILEPSVLRSLNALHLSAALEIGDELDALVTYDQGLTEAARTLGIWVLAPA